MDNNYHNSLEEYLMNNSLAHYHILTVKEDLNSSDYSKPIKVYIRPEGVDGDTLDFLVCCNQLIPDPDCQPVQE